MQHHLISPTPTVLENPILKLNWSLILYLKALINWVSHVLYSLLNFLQQAGVLSPSLPQVHRKLRSSLWPAQEQLLQNKGLALPSAASSLICQPRFSSLAFTSSPQETPLTVAALPQPYKPPLWEVQPFFLGLCLVSPTLWRHLCSVCKPASLASDLYLSLAEFNVESIPGPTPTALPVWKGDDS